MEANYSFVGPRKDLSEKQASVFNPSVSFSPYNYLLTKQPDYFVYLYNVSEQSFKVSRPPVFRELTIPGIKGVGLNDIEREKFLAEGGNTERYILATRIPSPVVTPKSTPDSDQFDYDAMDGRRFVMDIINPDNLGVDQDAFIDPKNITGQGNNLGSKGLFFSMNNPPLKAEVDAAYARMERYYKSKLDEARTVEVSAPATLSAVLGPEHHAAADYFGEETSWHGKKIKAVVCDICGERTRENAAFHKMEDGGLCIKDWSRAIKAGVRTRAQAFEATEDPQFAPKTPAAPVAPATPEVPPTTQQ